MAKRPRRNHGAAFKAKVALEAIKSVGSTHFTKQIHRAKGSESQRVALEIVHKKNCSNV